MLTMNLCSSVGLCNGATGPVVDIIYQNNHQPPDLPIAVIVEFENYRGPVFNEIANHCVSQYAQSLSHHKQKQVSMRGNSYLLGLLGL